MRNTEVMLVLAVLAMTSHYCFAQGAADYPSKPVRVIVSSSPGGSTDMQARMFAGKLSEILKRQFIVENRAGGSGTIGNGFVAKAAPDGYTVLATGAVFTVTPPDVPNIPYDLVKDFAPVSLLAKAPYLLFTHPSLPVKTVKDLISLAKSKPAALDMGVGFTGSFTHLAGSYFTSAANVKVTFIPFKGSGDVITNAIAGHIHVAFGSVLATIQHVKSGRLRALAVSSAQRSSVLPELPTIAESGVPGYDLITWHGWVAPAGTPGAVVSKLSTELARAVRSADIAKVLAEDGGEPVGSTPEQLQQLISVEVPRWRKIMKDSGM